MHKGALDTLVESLRSITSDVTSKQVQFSPGTAVETDLCACIAVRGKQELFAFLHLPNATASAFASMLTGEESRPFDAESREALQELLNQVSGRWADHLRTSLADAGLTVSVTIEAAKPLVDGAWFRCEVGESVELMFAVTVQQATAEVPTVEPLSTTWDLLLDVEVDVQLRFGTRELTLKETLALAPGEVIELDRRTTESVELIVAGRVFARGEAVLIDGHYGLRVTELVAVPA